MADDGALARAHRQLVRYEKERVALHEQVQQLDRDREVERNKRIDAEADAISWFEQCDMWQETVLRLGGNIRVTSREENLILTIPMKFISP